MAKRTPLAIERDAEEIFNILYFEENFSTLSDELAGVEELQLVFLPSKDGKDSEKDDAPSNDEEGSANIKDVGRGVLSQSAEIRAITADEKKRYRNRSKCFGTNQHICKAAKEKEQKKTLG